MLSAPCSRGNSAGRFIPPIPARRRNRYGAQTDCSEIMLRRHTLSKVGPLLLRGAAVGVFLAAKSVEPRLYGTSGLAVSIFAGKSRADHPPPSASIKATLSTSRLCWIANAVCWFDSSSVCSVITLVYGTVPA